MLRWSTDHTGRPIEMRALADRAVDPLLPGAEALLDLVDGTLLGSRDAAEARKEIEGRFGPAGVIRAAGVFGNFEMMNRLADGVGVPVGPATRKREAALLETLGLDRIAH